MSVGTQFPTITEPGPSVAPVPASPAPLPAPPPPILAPERVLLRGVRWQTYEALLEDMGERPIHLTYDRGDLEIMTMGPVHERHKKLLARVVETLSWEARIPAEGFGSVTCRRESLEKGFEHDECYY